MVPDGELEVPGDDTRLLVIPGGVPGELKDLRGEILHHGGHVDGGPGAHPLGVVALPATSSATDLRSLWILPTGNWRPALLERDLALPFTLPPLPRPDISKELVCNRVDTRANTDTIIICSEIFIISK